MLLAKNFQIILIFYYDKIYIYIYTYSSSTEQALLARIHGVNEVSENSLKKSTRKSRVLLK